MDEPQINQLTQEPEAIVDSASLPQEGEIVEEAPQAEAVQPSPEPSVVEPTVETQPEPTVAPEPTPQPPIEEAGIPMPEETPETPIIPDSPETPPVQPDQPTEPEQPATATSDVVPEETLNVPPPPVLDEAGVEMSTIRSDETGDKVYLLREKKRYWIKNPETLAKLGFYLGKEKRLPFSELLQYSEGEPVDMTIPGFILPWNRPIEEQKTESDTPSKIWA